MSKPDNETFQNDDRREFFRNLSPAAFAALGAEGIAYIKPATVDGEDVFEVRLADGREVAVLADRDLAEIMIRQNDLEAASVH